MSVKRFVAADMRRALELVKQEMGPDAIILSSNRVKEGVEIVTSDDANYQSVSEQESSPSIFVKSHSSSRSINRHASEVPSASAKLAHNDQLFEEQLKAAMNANNNQHEAIPENENRSLFGKLRQDQDASINKQAVQIKTQEQKSIQGGGRSAIDYYNEKANQSNDSIDVLNPEVCESSEFSVPFHLASIQYEPGDTLINFDLDKKRFLMFANDAEGLPVGDANEHDNDISNVDDFLDEQFGQLKSEILEMRELLRHQIESKSRDLATIEIKETTGQQENKIASISHNNLNKNHDVNSHIFQQSIKKTIKKRLIHLGIPNSEIEKSLALIDQDSLKPKNNHEERLMVSYLDKAWSNILADISHRLTPAATVKKISTAKTKNISVFAGLKGSGKKDLIGKFATQHVLENGSDNLIIISLSEGGYSFNQNNTLDRLSSILSVQHFTVGHIEDVVSIITHSKTDATILVDLPAIQLSEHRDKTVRGLDRKSNAKDENRLNTELVNALHLLKLIKDSQRINEEKITPVGKQSKNTTTSQFKNNVNSYLVLSAITTKSVVNRLLVSNSQSMSSTISESVDSCIITQLDRLESTEENTFGSLLGSVLSAGLPISYTTNGACLPHHLQTARGFQLVTAAVKVMKKTIQSKNEKLKKQLNVSKLKAKKSFSAFSSKEAVSAQATVPVQATLSLPPTTINTGLLHTTSAGLKQVATP